MKLLPSKRILTANERIAEVLFGLIMVLTFTGSLSVATAGQAEVRTMLIGALGCNLAWGIIDGIFYLMGCLAERGHNLRAWRAFKRAATPEVAHRVISRLLPSAMARTLTSTEYEAMRLKLVELPEPPKRPGLRKGDFLGAITVLFWVFITTFPVAIPFLIFQNVSHATRASNAVGIVLLFISGYAFGRISEYQPWLTGLAMVLIGGALVALTIALGG
jgi:hypothetical protein